MSEFRSAITQGADGRWIVTTGNLETVYAPTDRAAAVQIATLQQRILELEEERERLRSTLHRVTQTCSEKDQECQELSEALRDIYDKAQFCSYPLGHEVGVIVEKVMPEWFE